MPPGNLCVFNLLLQTNLHPEVAHSTTAPSIPLSTSRPSSRDDAPMACPHMCGYGFLCVITVVRANLSDLRHPVLIILPICIIRWYVHKTLRTVMRMDTLFSTGRSSGSSVLPIYVLLPNHPHPPLNRGHAGSSHIFSSDPFHWPRTLPPAVGLMVSQQGWVRRIPVGVYDYSSPVLLSSNQESFSGRHSVNSFIGLAHGVYPSFLVEFDFVRVFQRKTLK